MIGKELCSFVVELRRDSFVAEFRETLFQDELTSKVQRSAFTAVLALQDAICISMKSWAVAVEVERKHQLSGQQHHTS